MNVGIDDEMMPGNDIQIITEHLDSMALKEDCQTVCTYCYFDMCIFGWF